jgi:hypothetical protein
MAWLETDRHGRLRIGAELPPASEFDAIRHHVGIFGFVR